MADSDSDAGESGVDGNDAPFDPTQLAAMSDKDRKKWEKNAEKWRVFMDFLVRHIAVATFRYNCFENDDMARFLEALDRAERIRSATKLKKGEEARISTFKVMRDTADLMVKERYVNEANHIRNFLDIAGRMRGTSMIAGGFFKALKKGNVSGLDKIKHYLDYWKGFTVRSYDYAGLAFRGVDADGFNELERKFLVWPAVVRTAINLSQKFLKKASDSTGLELLATDPRMVQKHMQAAEFAVATHIEDMLFKKVVQETKTFSLLGGNLAPSTPSADTGDKSSKKFGVFEPEDISPELLKPIPDDGMLLSLPADPPKEKKGGKKKKASGKAKGRSASASSHKGGKKKKKK